MISTRAEPTLMAVTVSRIENATFFDYPGPIALSQGTISI